MNRPYYFGAGPAALPTEVLCEVQQELLNWRGTGLSILELGHRTTQFIELMDSLEASLREVMDIPAGYHVLFMSEPARAQFAMVPLNCLAEGEEAGYWVTGLWSALALEEAQKVKTAYTLTSVDTLKEKTAYVYYTSNETVNGVRCEAPAVSVPLVADMTSCLLTEPFSIEKHGLIFAGAQKNLANAGLTVVIVSDQFLKTPQHTLPSLWDYRTWITSRSLCVTPPTFNCYLMLKMLNWVKAQGGVQGLYEQNLKKAKALYDYLDASAFYFNEVKPIDRSIVNVTFRLKNQDKERALLAFAKQRGLLSLAGHRTVGGLRASLYNAMPFEGVVALIACLHEFERENGC